MPNLALPVVIVSDEAGASRAFVGNAASLLARSVDLHMMEMHLSFNPAVHVNKHCSGSARQTRTQGRFLVLRCQILV